MKEDTDERVWALVGAQSILCTLFFLALLYLNFEIWHQYFFLILWAFVLSHAFKAGLDDLQEWAEHVSDSISKADRKRIICIFCVSMFRCDRDSNKNCCTLPSRVYKKLKNFAGSYGLYFLGGVYIVYWFKNHYIYTIMRRPRLIIWHLGYLSMFILLFFFSVNCIWWYKCIVLFTLVLWQSKFCCSNKREETIKTIVNETKYCQFVCYPLINYIFYCKCNYIKFHHDMP